MTTRRLFLRAGAIALAVPAIVRASSIMKIWTPPATWRPFWARSYGLDLGSGFDLTAGAYVTRDMVARRILRWEPFEISIVSGCIERLAGQPAFRMHDPLNFTPSPVAQSRINDTVACAQDDVGEPARLKSNRFLTGVAGGLASTPGDFIA